MVILSEEKRIELFSQGKTIAFNCRKGEDEKIKKMLGYPKEGDWRYVDRQISRMSIYGSWYQNHFDTIKKYKENLLLDKFLQERIKSIEAKALGYYGCKKNQTSHAHIMADFINGDLEPKKRGYAPISSFENHLETFSRKPISIKIPQSTRDKYDSLSKEMIVPILRQTIAETINQYSR